MYKRQVLELYGTLRPLISGVHSAKIIFAINGIFENSPITKQYKIEWIPGTYYFSTKLGIEPNQNYTLSYTVTYYDYTGKEQESKYYFWCKMTRKRKKYVKKLSY